MIVAIALLMAMQGEIKTKCVSHGSYSVCGKDVYANYAGPFTFPQSRWEKFIEPAVEEDRPNDCGIDPGMSPIPCHPIIKVWTCTDKRRVLMTTEGGEKFCVLFPKGDADAR